MNNLRIIYILSAIIYFTQGIKSLPSQPLFYYFKENLHLTVSQTMYISSLTSIAWIIKPLYGYLSDRFPIFGYRRKSYIILSSSLSLIVCLIIGISPYLFLWIIIGLLIIDSFGGAMRDVAIDGVMVEEGKKYNLTGKIQSIQWGFLTLAGLLTGVVGGYISEHFDYHLAFLLVLIFPLLIILFTLKYNENKAITKKKKLVKNKNIFLVFKNKNFLLSTLFLFFLWLSPAIGTPYMNKLRYDLHLSKTLIGILFSLPSLSGIIGAFIYYKVSQKINLKKWLYIGTIVSAITTLAYIYLTVKLAFIYAFLFGLSGMFIHLLIMDFTARSCATGNEATTFALLCSVLNLAGWLSTLIGAKIYVVVKFNGLIIISAIFTLLCIGFIPFLKIDNLTKAN